MKRIASLVVVMVGLAALAGGITAASGASALPTLTISESGTKTITVSGTAVSGAVKIVSTFTGKGQGEYGLVRLAPGTTFAQANHAVQSHHGDTNALSSIGDVLVADAGAPSVIQTVLVPGTYAAVNLTGQGASAQMTFTVVQSSAPAALPKPGGTVRSIDFGFRGAKKLHRGELVRFENAGYLVHMIAGIRVKNARAAAAETAALRAGNDRLSRRLALGFVNFQGPVSSGGLQQSVIHAKPGFYVLACFMNTEDGREHTQLGMERTIRITK